MHNDNSRDDPKLDRPAMSHALASLVIVRSSWLARAQAVHSRSRPFLAGSPRLTDAQAKVTELGLSQQWNRGELCTNNDVLNPSSANRGIRLSRFYSRLSVRQLPFAEPEFPHPVQIHRRLKLAFQFPTNCPESGSLSRNIGQDSCLPMPGSDYIQIAQADRRRSTTAISSAVYPAYR